MWIAIAAAALLLILSRSARGRSTRDEPLESNNLDWKVIAFADAIAFAEGYFRTDYATLTQRLNNPCALKDPITGEMRSFATPADGWAAGQRQARLMLTGTSSVYGLDWTFAQVAYKYTGNDSPDSWAVNVTDRLGISTAHTLRDWAEL